MITGRIILKGFSHKWTLLGIDHMSFVALFSDSYISKWWFGRKPALRYFFFLALLHFLGEIRDVFLSEHYFNIPSKFFIRFCIFMYNKILLYEMYLSFLVCLDPVIRYYGFFQVPSESIYFLAKKYRYAFLFHKLHHFFKHL